MSADADPVDIDALREQVRRVRARLKPIPLPDQPRETDSDGDLDITGQCLRFAAAHSLRVPPLSLPRVTEGDDRWELWTREMLELGYHVEDLPLDSIPPPDGMPWIAVIDSGEATHAVGCVGLTVLHTGRIEPREPMSIVPSSVRSAFRFRTAA